MRRNEPSVDEQANQLRAELDMLKSHAKQLDVVMGVTEPDTGANAGQSAVGQPPSEHAIAFDRLTPCEQAAGSLGVHPEAWKPITFMNNHHYKNLIEANAIDDELARRIEVRDATKCNCFSYVH